jgi:putative glutamine amidotransferase
MAAEPFIWQQNPQSAPMIFPQKENQTRQEAVEEYFQKLHGKKSVAPLLVQEEIQDLVVDGQLQYQKGIFKDLDNSHSNKPRFIVVTNELRELYSPPYGKRIVNVIKRLEALGAEVIALPVLHDLTLNAKDSKEFRAKLIEAFDAQLILGGADIDPYLYGDKKTYARGIVRSRDVSELKFVRQFVESKKGMNFGICRGHQMCAVANHKRLVQDIQIEEGASEIHLNGHHDIDIDIDDEFFSIFDDKKLLVNSLHHQAVFVPVGDRDYKVIASSLDNKPIVEAISFRNGKGVTLQFHPELMFDETGDKILEQFIKMTIKNNQVLKGHIPCLELIKDFLPID